MHAGRSLALGLGWLQRNLLVELSCALFACLLWRGDVAAGRWPGLLLAGWLAALLLHRLWLLQGRLSPRRVGAPGASAEHRQVGLLLTASLYLLIALTGGLASPVYPALYLVLAAAGGLEERPWNTLVVVGAALALEALLGAPAWPAGWAQTASHAAAIAGFPFVSRLLVAAARQLVRREEAAKLAKERAEHEQAAREFRLSGAASRDGTRALRDEERAGQRQLSSLRRLEEGIHNLLDVVFEALRPHSVAFYRLSTDDRSVRLMDARSDSDQLVRTPMPAGEGVLGAIIKRLSPVSFDHLRDGHELLTYYATRVPIRSFLGVPVLDGAHVRGVLLADRRVDVPFSDDDRRMLSTVAVELLHEIDTERVLADMDKLLSESACFYEASKQLNRALGLQEVIDEVLSAARLVLPGVDFAALVLREGDKLVLAGAQGLDEYAGWREKHLQQELHGQSHLVAQVLKEGSVLPEAPFHQREGEQRLVFGRQMPLPPLASLKIFPLRVAGEQGRKSQSGKEPIIGALVAAGQRPGLFPANRDKSRDLVGVLQTIANMAAISIQNAQRYQQLERLATTDGLTGLHNHRRFQELAEELASTSLRYQRPLSMLLTDIDHFKKVNDTYGHPVGDQVLKRVARVLGDLARATDRVCRYGGEEFAVLLPETDAEGARMLAERIREEIKQQEHQAADGKPFRVTLSLGICTMPEHARHKQELIDRADQALYHAKRNGRDKAVHYAELGSAKSQGA
ncbi:MAG TPA: diguanylate cyclase [Myxococcota bacterium]|nr:diguanylate cyclase [Myxococcota bacterium]HRY93890.1 diguanylate cyclase [Myxococcota bacterium]HSA23579.1 diguanylate cyclase [Myxococcota bacterium]